MEVIEVEVVGLAEVPELPAVLRGDDGGGAAAEAAVVDARDGGVVVAEFGFDFRRSYKGGEFGLFGYARTVVMIVLVDMVIGGGRHWGFELGESIN